MSKLDDIQNLIHQLSKEEIERLREWFDEFEGDIWDSEFSAHGDDAAMKKSADAAQEEHRDGKAKEQ